MPKKKKLIKRRAVSKSYTSSHMTGHQMMLIAVIAVIGSVCFIAVSFLLPFRVSSIAPSVTISELALFSGNPANHFIELHNYTMSTVSIDGLKLVKMTGNSDSKTLIATLNGTIKPHGYFLVANSTSHVTSDLSFTMELAQLQSGDTVALVDTTDEILDMVGIGTNAIAEGTPIGFYESEKSLERKANDYSTTESMDINGADALLGNAYDTDQNSTDFVLRNIPQPQSTRDTEEPRIPPTNTPFLSPIPTPTPTSAPFPSITPSPTRPLTPTPTIFATPTPFIFVTNTPTMTLTPTLTPTPTSRPTPTNTIKPTIAPSITPTPTLIPTPTQTPTPTPRTYTITTRNGTVVCTINRRIITTPWGIVTIPDIQCVRIHSPR